MQLMAKPQIRTWLAMLFVATGLSSVSPVLADLTVESAPDFSAPTHAAPDFTGTADYYADRFHGKRTASGQLHDKTKLTAVHRTLPFGTRVKLVNRHNKKSCTVVINDRGPFTKSRIIDVSREAANKLGLISGKRLVDCYIVDSQRSAAQ